MWNNLPVSCIALSHLRDHCKKAYQSLHLYQNLLLPYMGHVCHLISILVNEDETALYSLKINVSYNMYFIHQSVLGQYLPHDTKVWL